MMGFFTLPLSLRCFGAAKATKLFQEMTELRVSVRRLMVFRQNEGGAADCTRKELCCRRNIELSILLEDNGMLQPISRTSPNISDSAKVFFLRTMGELIVMSHDVTPKDTFQRDISCFRET